MYQAIRKLRVFAGLMLMAMLVAVLAACQPATTTTSPASTPQESSSQANNTEGTDSEGTTSQPEGSVSAPSGEPIVIGGLAPLTGGVSVYGIASNQGTELAIKQINEKGGINGRPVEYVVIDEQGDAEQAITAYSRLVNEHKIVALIGDVTSTPSLAVAQRAAKDGIPMITPTSTAAKITLEGSNIFRVCFLDPDQGKAMADYAHEGLKATKAAMIYNAADEYSVGLAEAFEAQAKELGLEMVANQTYNDGDKDFRTQLTTIAAAAPDVLFVPDYYGTNILILNQAKDAGVTATLLGGDGWDGIITQTPEDNPNEADGAFFANHYATSDTNPIVQDFLKAYEAEYDSVPISFSALGYDAAMILLKAIEAAGTTDSAAVVEAIQKSNYDGVTGNITFDENGDPLKPISILEVKNGAYELVTKLEITER